MADVRNILFIMCDQLRWDYLSSAGHPTLETPNIDALAAGGVQFSRAFVQSPVCGSSRMSAYTGRYMFNHGSSWNSVPLSIGERTLGDYLRPLGLRTVLIGKTHMAADTDGLARLGVDPVSEAGVLVSQCGFEPVERDDGLHPSGFVDPHLAYNEFLKARGYPGDNPWQDWANSAEGPDGEVLSGWLMRHARKPARVREEDSETPYMTDRAIDFIAAQGDVPWCMHLSFIKPHWPYMAPPPYNDLYGPNQCLGVKRDGRERAATHPVVAAFMDHPESVNFRRDEVRDTVIPTYMGLVKQIDDHLGRLFQAMEDQGRMDDTLIVFTSDHGDYLGDHWLGEKELFHEAIVRVPMIVRDPSPAADAARGTVDDRLIEAIDLVPTFIEAAGGTPPAHLMDGRSLLGALRGGAGGEHRVACRIEIHREGEGLYPAASLVAHQRAGVACIHEGHPHHRSAGLEEALDLLHGEAAVSQLQGFRSGVAAVEEQQEGVGVAVDLGDLGLDLQQVGTDSLCVHPGEEVDSGRRDAPHLFEEVRHLDSVPLRVAEGVAALCSAVCAHHHGEALPPGLPGLGGGPDQEEAEGDQDRPVPLGCLTHRQPLGRTPSRSTG